MSHSQALGVEWRYNLRQLRSTNPTQKAMRHGAEKNTSQRLLTGILSESIP